MPTQKSFKRRVRARMTKTGEAYTAARHQLLRKAVTPGAAEDPDGSPPQDAADAPPADEQTAATATESALVSDDAMLRGTGKSHAEWFAILDAWGATGQGHTEIARWLREAHGVSGWWAQGVTVAYERARGLRQRHQMSAGFAIAAIRTVAVDAERLLAAFTSGPLRERWLPGVSMTRRPTRAASSARFDWPDPPSRVAVLVSPRGEGKATVSVQHEQLPDAETAERLKAWWRERLGALKSVLERG